ncbi:MAG: hypothetical protein ACTHLZ_04480 [Tepidisphaeraceae bacterium]
MVRLAARLACGAAMMAMATLGGDRQAMAGPATRTTMAGLTTRPAPRFRITYKLSDGSEKWDPAIRKQITDAMDAAVAFYNANGEFDKHLTANYSPGTPTADSNYDGWINFGHAISKRVALHEIAHTLGVGTYRRWSEFSKNGKWTGRFAIAQLHKLDGPNAVLHSDRMHFWPYGLNYDNESSPENDKRNVLMVIAMRRDMGIVNGKN